MPTGTPTPLAEPTAGPLPPGPNIAGLLSFAIGLVVVGIIAARFLTGTLRRDRKAANVLSLEMIAPPDRSIAIAGRAVTFTATAAPVERGAEIVWTCASQPHFQAHGTTCSLTWTETGVHQVIATLDDLACATLVYVFATPGGTGSLADLMQSAPPAAKSPVFPAIKRVAKRAPL